MNTREQSNFRSTFTASFEREFDEQVLMIVLIVARQSALRRCDDLGPFGRKGRRSGTQLDPSVGALTSQRVVLQSSGQFFKKKVLSSAAH